MLNNRKLSHFSGLAIQGVSVLLVLALIAMALPTPAQAADPTATPTTSTSSSSSTSACASTYTVKSGDTFKEIAKEYGVTVAALAAANNIRRPYTITTGQKLCIPATTTGVTSKNFKMDVSIISNVLNVAVTGLPKSHAYSLKVRDGRGNSAWTKIGGVVSDKNGALAAHAKLSEKLASAKYLQVCLKDMATDALICRSVTNK